MLKTLSQYFLRILLHGLSRGHEKFTCYMFADKVIFWVQTIKNVGLIILIKVHTSQNPTDVLTKCLPKEACCHSLRWALIENGYGPHEFLRKVVLFRWSLVHYGIPMKSWMLKHHHDLKCDNCGRHIESVQHVLWVCPIARAVWKRMLRILYPVYGKPM